MSEVQLTVEFSKGPLGRVWLGWFSSGDEAGRAVTVRRLSQKVLGIDGARRVAQAAETARRVSHPRIAKVLGVTASEVEISTIGEYVEGEYLSTLRSLIFRSGTRLEPKVVVRIVLDALRAAEAAKSELSALNSKIETRVLFPDTIMIARFGETLLGDIGISGTVASLPNVRLGPDALPHLAPEEISGSNVDADRADVYTAGTILLELTHNRPLFAGDDPESVSGDILQQALNDVNAEALAGLVRIIARAVRRDPKARFAHLQEMIAALEALPASLVGTEEDIRRALEELAQSRLDSRGKLVSFNSQAPPASETGEALPAGFYDSSNDPPTSALRHRLLISGADIQAFAASSQVAAQRPAQDSLAPDSNPTDPEPTTVSPSDAESANSTKFRFWIRLAVAALVIGALGYIGLRLKHSRAPDDSVEPPQMGPSQ